MKSFSLLLSFVTAAAALYPGDVVQFWNHHTMHMINTTTPSLSGPHASYIAAYVHTAILVAAEETQRQPQSVQQLAVSHAAHDALTKVALSHNMHISMFQREIEDAVGLPAASVQAKMARRIGEGAAVKVARYRENDGFSSYVRYDFPEPAVGVYQATPPNFMSPMAQAATLAKPFGGINTLPVWKGPPAVTSREYESYLVQVLQKGAKVNHTRTPDETEIALYWLGLPILYWNKLARSLTTDRFPSILASAQFHAKLNWAMFNAGVIGFTAKNKYDAWRPITALRWNETYLRSGRSYYSPEWEPMLPTPGHQEYLSGHSVFAAAAAGVLKRELKGSRFAQPIEVENWVTMNNVGLLKRRYESLDQMVEENGASRVYTGAHFLFACDQGNAAGEKSADMIWKRGAKGYLN